MQDLRQLRYLLVHLGWAEFAIEWHRWLAQCHRRRGFDVVPFCAVPNPPAQRYDFQTLDRLWKARDPDVVRLHDALLEAARDRDVLINYNGANLHPEWLADLRTFNVYVCWDDPESSPELSAPVARYFDFAFTGNAACVPLYQSWGIRRCDYLPFCVNDREYDPTLTSEQILSQPRDIDVIFVGERVLPWRHDRLDRLVGAFPTAFVRGRGWPAGFLPAEQKLPTYRRAKIGWNVHNSVGPVNLRTFALPANGIMEICDNKCRLGSIFDLDREVVGFDTIEECIDLTRYYLAHERERREIAVQGFERVMRDYTEEGQWACMLAAIEPWLPLKTAGTLQTPAYPVSLQVPARPSLRARIGSALRQVGRTLRMPTSGRTSQPSPPSPPADAEPARPPLLQSYVRNEEAGPVDQNMKEKRGKSGGFLEWPDMVALNWCVASRVGPSRRIVELGGGTGCFAHEAAADPKRFILCSDLDRSAIEWARRHRQRPNIEYVNRLVTPEDGPFDLVVAIDVIEHLQDFRGFIAACARLAPRAILTTPNKNREAETSTESPPACSRHVQEWTAGEFYWILTCFYRNVDLLGMPDPHLPQAERMQLWQRHSPLIAECTSPF